MFNSFLMFSKSAISSYVLKDISISIFEADILQETLQWLLLSKAPSLKAFFWLNFSLLAQKELQAGQSN